MRKFPALRRGLYLALVSVVLAGCVSRYQITLTNGNTMTTRNRPRLNKQKSAYEYKDLRGQPMTVPIFRVKTIEPL